VVAVIVVLFTTTILLAAASPKLTVAPGEKFAPVMVTGVPPAEGPWAGLMEVTLAPVVGEVPPVVKVQVGPPTARLAIVLETILHR
jgi:hypothetical protein